jgi:hypothetical protein
MYLNGKQHGSKQKRTLIATVPDLYLTTVNILTHLISRYQLPLKLPHLVSGLWSGVWSGELWLISPSPLYS